MFKKRNWADSLRGSDRKLTTAYASRHLVKGWICKHDIGLSYTLAGNREGIFAVDSSFDPM